MIFKKYRRKVQIKGLLFTAGATFIIIIALSIISHYKIKKALNKSKAFII